MVCVFYSSYPTSDVVLDEWLFDMDVMSEALCSSGHDTARLANPFIPKSTTAIGNHHIPLLTFTTLHNTPLQHCYI